MHIYIWMNNDVKGLLEWNSLIGQFPKGMNKQFMEEEMQVNMKEFHPSWWSEKYN